MLLLSYKHHLQYIKKKNKKKTTYNTSRYLTYLQYVIITYYDRFALTGTLTS